MIRVILSFISAICIGIIFVFNIDYLIGDAHEISYREYTSRRGKGYGTGRSSRHDAVSVVRPQYLNAPAVSVEIMMPDGSNLIMWLSKLSNYFTGFLWIKWKIYYQWCAQSYRSPIACLHCVTIPRAGTNSIHEVLSSSYKQSEIFKPNNVEIFGFMLLCLSDEGI